MNDKNTEGTIRQTFLEEFDGIIKGLTTPQEMADYVLEYVVNENVIVTLDFQDALTTLRGVKEGDGMVVQIEKDELQSALKECEAKLKDAHPNMTITSLLLQIIVPQESSLTMNDMRIINDYSNSIDENLQAVWGVAPGKDNSDKYKIFIMMGFND